MNSIERITKIQRILERKRYVSIGEFLDELEVSRATFKRDLDYLRERLQIEIRWSREQGGYFRVGDQGKVPGPMYTVAETHALLLVQELLTQMQPGLLENVLGPLEARLQDLLGTDTPAQSAEIRRRIRILHMASRPVGPKHFQVVSLATLSRKRLHLVYRSRYRNEKTAREVSPQRLVYYRANWYLDSWCHLRNELRSFALDMIGEAEVLPKAAQEIEDAKLQAHLGGGYGIFSGEAKGVAVLRFEPHIAQWVSREVWHPKQTQQFDDSGYFLLRIPFAEEYELAMDILRYGPGVEVLAPDSLRSYVHRQILAAAALYRTPSTP